MRTTTRSNLVLAAAALAGWLAAAVPAQAQTFLSGSTGADGAFVAACAPAPCTVNQAVPPSGAFNYTTYTVPTGITVRYTPNATNTPVTVLASGLVDIAGTVDVSGSPGLPRAASGTVANPGGAGGPGGYRGGTGGLRNGTRHTAGFGPGGGQAQGQGTQGNADGGVYIIQGNFPVDSNAVVRLVPLFGGSGGGGNADDASFALGSSGGGGGGAIVIASSTRITVSGSVIANGGNAANTSGAGSGGAIRLVAPQVDGAGSLLALGGTGSAFASGAGRIRLEAFTLGFTGTANPTASQSTAVGPVTPASTPALANLPTLAIASVGGVNAPAVPQGQFTTADVALAAGATNPVTVVVAATSTPVGSPTGIRVRLIRLSSNVITTTDIPSASHTGTFANSTASVAVTFPVGEVSVLQAWAIMNLTGQVASLFPLIDGEPVMSVAMASPLEDGRPVLNLVTASGREKRFDELAAAEQLQVAAAWQALSLSANQR